jgi:hypothetical protein
MEMRWIKARVLRDVLRFGARGLGVQHRRPSAMVPRFEKMSASTLAALITAVFSGGLGIELFFEFLFRTQMGPPGCRIQPLWQMLNSKNPYNPRKSVLRIQGTRAQCSSSCRRMSVTLRLEDARPKTTSSLVIEHCKLSPA